MLSLGFLYFVHQSYRSKSAEVSCLTRSTHLLKHSFQQSNLPCDCFNRSHYCIVSIIMTSFNQRKQCFVVPSGYFYFSEVEIQQRLVFLTDTFYLITKEISTNSDLSSYINQSVQIKTTAKLNYNFLKKSKCHKHVSQCNCNEKKTPQTFMTTSCPLKFFLVTVTSRLFSIHK